MQPHEMVTLYPREAAAKIQLLEEEVARLRKQLEEAFWSNSEEYKMITEENERLRGTINTLLADGRLAIGNEYAE